tara:strand:+ start:85 stop:603 length:519 start_codon:yes stop_codon:yes gene_type:complete
MSIQDKFESNSSGCLQLTDRAVVEVWQTSSTLNEAERKEWSLFRDLAIQKLEDYPNYRIELQTEIKEWLNDVTTVSLIPSDQRDWRDNAKLNGALGMIKSYAGPEKNGGCEDGLINWIRQHRINYSSAPLKSRATRLRKKGVTSLKDLKRAKTGREPSYYQDLNAYALTVSG